MSEVRPSEERLIPSPLAQALHSSVFTFTAATTGFGQVKPETRERAEGPAALGGGEAEGGERQRVISARRERGEREERVGGA